MDEEGEVFDLLEEVAAEDLGMVLQLALHLPKGFVVVPLKELPFLELVAEITVEVLQKDINLNL